MIDRTESARHYENPRLHEEVWSAHRDWMIALEKFEYALHPDQIDYAIFIIEAAEKRFDMLVKQAKAEYEAWEIEARVNAVVRGEGE